MPRPAWWIAAAGAVLLAGCPSRPATNTNSGPAALPFEGVPVRLLVAGDPELAEAVRKLAGEWRARTGALLDVAECEPAALRSADRPAADAVICPSADLPSLVQHGGVAPLPRDILTTEQIPWLDVFPSVRNGEATWQGQPCAVPLGSPVLVCYYRADLLEELGQRPPRTWQEYHALSEKLSQRGKAKENGTNENGDDAQPWRGSLEPLAPGWAGLTLLARAAAYAKHPYSSSALFQTDTFEPLIAEPPYVRALEELVLAAKASGGEPPRLDPAAVREEFWQGRAALALTWAHGGRPQGDKEKPAFAVGFAELPGSLEVYRSGRQTWEKRRPEDFHRATLISSTGRLGVVLKGTAEQPAEAALQLLFALAGKEWNPVVREASGGVTLFLQEHADAPRTWVEPQADYAAARQYAEVVRESLSRGEMMSAVRMPGRELYLAALDRAVEQALAGTATAAEALQAAAAEWKTISADLGLEQQREAYKSGLEK